ncbi:MAG: glycosyltransferase [Thermodesulfobacteriota bacterium]
MDLIFFLPELGIGGAERQFSQLASRLARRGHYVSFLTVFPGGANWEWLEARGGVALISLVRSKAWRRPGRAGQLFLAAARLAGLTRGRGRFILYSAMNLANVMAWLAVRLNRRVRLVWGVRASDMSLNWYHALPFWWGALVSPTVPLLIANSRFGLEHHRRLGYRPGRSLVIPNGVDTDLFRPDREAGRRLRREWGVAEEEQLVGLVARVDPVKDHAAFLRAASRLGSRQPLARFVCVGGGPEPLLTGLKNLAAELGLGRRLIWAGDRPDMAAVYNALDVAVSCSTSEGFSNTLSEAMSCGVPVVATDVGDSNWLVGRAGQVVGPGDPEALERAMSAVLSQPKETLGLIGRQRIISEFSLNALIDRTEEALNSLQADG